MSAGKHPVDKATAEDDDGKVDVPVDDGSKAAFAGALDVMCLAGSSAAFADTRMLRKDMPYSTYHPS